MNQSPQVGLFYFNNNRNENMTLATEDFISSGRVGLTADEIRELRRRKGLPLGQMAKLLGVSPATLEAWESGRRNASLDARKIAQMTGRWAERAVSQRKKIDSSSVRLLREILGIDVPAIAKRFKLSVGSWYSIEQGRRNVPKRLEEEIAKKYSDLIFQVRQLRESL